MDGVGQPPEKPETAKPAFENGKGPIKVPTGPTTKPGRPEKEPVPMERPTPFNPNKPPERPTPTTAGSPGKPPERPTGVPVQNKPRPTPDKPANYCLTRESWSPEKKEWCCKNKKIGCPTTTRPPIADGVPPPPEKPETVRPSTKPAFENGKGPLPTTRPAFEERPGHA